jgi:FkbH-like protein
MKSAVKRFDKFETPRIAQLTQRSNQFNLRTVRYTEGDIEAIRSDPNCIGLSFTLSDRFGEYGLISVIVLRRIAPDTALIDTWLMSCRVLKRGMEQHVLNYVVVAARQAGFRRVVGEYIATPKNGMVKDHYERLGFQPFGSQWELAVESFEPRPVHINSEELDG